jgi:hypothetical protein
VEEIAMSRISIALFSLLAFLSFSACGDDKAAHAKKINSTLLPTSNEHEVVYSSFTKDGVLYRQYDFGKAIFTVESEYLNMSDEKTLDMRWYWPELLPGERIIGSHQMRAKDLVITKIDFTGIGSYGEAATGLKFWQEHYCNSEARIKKPRCYVEEQSEYPEFKKYVLDKGNILYISKPGGPVTPQGTPLSFACVRALGDAGALDCGFLFQYYGSISIAVTVRNDVLPEWQDLTVRMDAFFKARFQEK